MPQGRRIFPSLSIRENLTMAARKNLKGDTSEWDIEKVYELFPVLKEREKIWELNYQEDNSKCSQSVER